MSVWKELNPPVYPEGDYVAVFCSKCGGKNRQDEGWRYKDDALQRAQHQAAIHSMGYDFTMMIASLGTPARLFYECGYCRDDDKKIKDEDEEDYDVPKAAKKRGKFKAKPAVTTPSVKTTRVTRSSAQAAMKKKKATKSGK